MLCFCCVITNGDDHPTPQWKIWVMLAYAEVWKPKGLSLTYMACLCLSHPLGWGRVPTPRLQCSQTSPHCTAEVVTTVQALYIHKSCAGHP